MSTLKFTKVRAGWYATEDGRYGAVADGYEHGALYEDGAITGGEWAAVFDPRGLLREGHNAGDNLDWFSTKREAIKFCQRHAR